MMCMRVNGGAYVRVRTYTHMLQACFLIARHADRWCKQELAGAVDMFWEEITVLLSWRALLSMIIDQAH